MTLKYTYITSFIFSGVSGIVNIFGIKHFGLVVTNITGHFSEIVQVSEKQIYPILGYIFCYIFGAVSTFSCFLISDKKNKTWIKSLPALLNFVIFLLFLTLQNQPIYLLFIAMSSQNALGISLSKGNIRPSQITGIIINLGDDLAHYFFGNSANRKKIKTQFLIKTLNMIGFITGGSLAFYWQNWAILSIPCLFYLFLGIYIIRKPI